MCLSALQIAGERFLLPPWANAWLEQNTCRACGSSMVALWPQPGCQGRKPLREKIAMGPFAEDLPAPGEMTWRP